MNIVHLDNQKLFLNFEVFQVIVFLRFILNSENTETKKRNAPSMVLEDGQTPELPLDSNRGQWKPTDVFHGAAGERKKFPERKSL